jgi:hypothetical protein
MRRQGAPDTIGYHGPALPIDYTIRDGLLSARASGVLDDETLLAYVHAVIADPTYDTAVADLFDARAVTDVRLTAAGIQTIATVIQQTGRASPRVAVIADAPAMFGMARMFEQLSDDVDVRVFREADAALEWLRPPASPSGPTLR